MTTGRAAATAVRALARARVWGWVLAALVGCVGCGEPTRGPAPSTTSSVGCPPCACGSASVVDASLVAFLSRARAAHHAADLAEQREERAEAIRVLRELVEGPVPRSPDPPPEAREVLADTRARLAELQSAAGEFAEADAQVAAGLELATSPTHFRGHLLEVRGLVEERRAASLEHAGNRDGARQARERAVTSYEAAMDVQEQVIRAALEGMGGAGAAPSATARPVETPPVGGGPPVGTATPSKPEPTPAGTPKPSASSRAAK